MVINKILSCGADSTCAGYTWITIVMWQATHASIHAHAGEARQMIYFWVGRHSSNHEKGAAAFITTMILSAIRCSVSSLAYVNALTNVGKMHVRSVVGLT